MTKDLRSRKGRFTVTCTFIEDTPDELLHQLFSRIIILRTTEKLWEDTLEYYAVSECFEPVTEGCTVPEYTAKFEKTEEGTYLIYWEKI